VDRAIILSEYKKYCKISSDINRLLPILNKYAKHCSHITEMGVRGGKSTWSLLASFPEKMVSYDIVYHPNIDMIRDAANAAGIIFEFIQKDVLSVDIEITDLLFLDTLHHFYQLTEELNRHSNKVRKYIIIHDTNTYAYKNERIPKDVSEALQINGIDISKYSTTSQKGLMPAINNFLNDNPEWKLLKHIKKNNGMTIVEKLK
jgi:hypothetical protein